MGGREEHLKRVWHSESQSQQIHICLFIYNQNNLNLLADVTELRREHKFRKQYDTSFVRKAGRQNPNNQYNKSFRTLLQNICHLRKKQGHLLTCPHLLLRHFFGHSCLQTSIYKLRQTLFGICSAPEVFQGVFARSVRNC